jgi:hypothetical protein
VTPGFVERRMIWIAFLTIGVIYLTDDLQGYMSPSMYDIYTEEALHTTGLGIPQHVAVGSQTTFAGCVCMILACFYLIVCT